MIRGKISLLGGANLQFFLLQKQREAVWIFGIEKAAFGHEGGDTLTFPSP